jgi:putative endonuclease
MTMRRRRLGQGGEAAAKRFLIGKGWRFEEANVRTSYGEIDLLFRDRQTLVAVEVKTRRAASPEVVTRQQLERVARSLQFLAAGISYHGPLRVDVVTVCEGACELTRDATSTMLRS